MGTWNVIQLVCKCMYVFGCNWTKIHLVTLLTVFIVTFPGTWFSSNFLKYFYHCIMISSSLASTQIDIVYFLSYFRQASPLSLKRICTVFMENEHGMKEESNSSSEMNVILNFMRRVWDDFVIHLLSVSDPVFSPVHSVKLKRRREHTSSVRMSPGNSWDATVFSSDVISLTFRTSLTCPIITINLDKFSLLSYLFIYLPLCLYIGTTITNQHLI
jgi:hypothetical protein